jgi:hypothetical protein
MREGKETNKQRERKKNREIKKGETEETKTERGERKKKESFFGYQRGEGKSFVHHLRCLQNQLPPIVCKSFSVIVFIHLSYQVSFIHSFHFAF